MSTLQFPYLDPAISPPAGEIYCIVSGILLENVDLHLSFDKIKCGAGFCHPKFRNLLDDKFVLLPKKGKDGAFTTNISVWIPDSGPTALLDLNCSGKNGVKSKQFFEFSSMGYYDIAKYLHDLVTELPQCTCGTAPHRIKFTFFSGEKYNIYSVKAGTMFVNNRIDVEKTVPFDVRKIRFSVFPFVVLKVNLSYILFRKTEKGIHSEFISEASLSSSPSNIKCVVVGEAEYAPIGENWFIRNNGDNFSVTSCGVSGACSKNYMYLDDKYQAPSTPSFYLYPDISGRQFVNFYTTLSYSDCTVVFKENSSKRLQETLYDVVEQFKKGKTAVTSMSLETWAMAVQPFSCFYETLYYNKEKGLCFCRRETFNFKELPLMDYKSLNSTLSPERIASQFIKWFLLMKQMQRFDSHQELRPPIYYVAKYCTDSLALEIALCCSKLSAFEGEFTNEYIIQNDFTSIDADCLGLGQRAISKKLITKDRAAELFFLCCYEVHRRSLDSLSVNFKNANLVKNVLDKYRYIIDEKSISLAIEIVQSPSEISFSDSLLFPLKITVDIFSWYMDNVGFIGSSDFISIYLMTYFTTQHKVNYSCACHHLSTLLQSSEFIKEEKPLAVHCSYSKEGVLSPLNCSSIIACSEALNLVPNENQIFYWYNSCGGSDQLATVIQDYFTSSEDFDS